MLRLFIMVTFIVGSICLLLALCLIVLEKSYFDIPAHEVKRQAIKGDSYASMIYPLIAYGRTLRSILLLMILLFSAIGLVLFARLAPVWLAIILVIVLLWLAFNWLPNADISKTSKRLTKLFSPILLWLVNRVYPLVVKIDGFFNDNKAKHTGIYELEDLKEIINRQAVQQDNRISDLQLGRLAKLLVFESTTVGKYMTPLKGIMTIAADEPIGPILLDDMHNSGQVAFPVTVKKNDPKLVGILNKDDVGLKSQGKVADYMHEPVIYINEDEPIENALAKFSLSGRALLIVNNHKHQTVGVLTLKDALSSILSPDTSINKVK